MTNRAISDLMTRKFFYIIVTRDERELEKLVLVILKLTGAYYDQNLRRYRYP